MRIYLLIVLKRRHHRDSSGVHPVLLRFLERVPLLLDRIERPEHKMARKIIILTFLLGDLAYQKTFRLSFDARKNRSLEEKKRYNFEFENS